MTRFLCLALALAVVPLVGCGGSKDPDKPSSSGDTGYTQMLKFSQCMRSHGLASFPDPVQQSDGGVSLTMNKDGATDPNSQQFKAAQTACRKFAPRRGGDHPMTAAQQQRFLRYSQCMRTHGVPQFPDPTFSGGGVRVRLPRGLGPDSPSLRAAENACRSLQPDKGGGGASTVVADAPLARRRSRRRLRGRSGPPHRPSVPLAGARLQRGQKRGDVVRHGRVAVALLTGAGERHARLFRQLRDRQPGERHVHVAPGQGHRGQPWPCPLSGRCEARVPAPRPHPGLPRAVDRDAGRRRPGAERVAGRARLRHARAARPDVGRVRVGDEGRGRAPPGAPRNRRDGLARARRRRVPAPRDPDHVDHGDAWRGGGTRTQGSRDARVGRVATASSADQGATPGSDAAPTVDVYVRPLHPKATGRLDQAPVQVAITTSTVRHALVVPVASLLAPAAGGYAVEVAGAAGARRLVPVRIGLFDDANGLVQVTGALRGGQRVAVPATS